MIRLVRDVLDKTLKDRNGENSGRIDGIVLELRDGQPPIVRFVAPGVTASPRMTPAGPVLASEARLGLAVGNLTVPADNITTPAPVLAPSAVSLPAITVPSLMFVVPL